MDYIDSRGRDAGEIWTRIRGQQMRDGTVQYEIELSPHTNKRSNGRIPPRNQDTIDAVRTLLMGEYEQGEAIARNFWGEMNYNANNKVRLQEATYWEQVMSQITKGHPPVLNFVWEP